MPFIRSICYFASLFLDLLSVLQVEKGRKLKGKEANWFVFQVRAESGQEKPLEINKGSRFPGPSLLTARIVEEDLLSGGDWEFQCQRI